MKRLADSDLLDYLKTWILKNNQIPSKNDFDKMESKFKSVTYRRHFGSWGNAVRLVGCTPHSPHGIKGMHYKQPIKNGFKITQNGYKWIYKPDHPYVLDKIYVPMHRLVMEEKLGRYLTPNEIVHHIDSNKLNNKISNLLLCTQADHTKLHKPHMRRWCLCESI